MEFTINIKWIIGTPPKKIGKKYLYMFETGVVCTGEYRDGVFMEPSHGTIDYRCDCCGRHATPIAYADCVEDLRRGDV